MKKPTVSRPSNSRTPVSLSNNNGTLITCSIPRGCVVSTENSPSESGGNRAGAEVGHVRIRRVQHGTRAIGNEVQLQVQRSQVFDGDVLALSADRGSRLPPSTEAPPRQSVRRL